MAGDGARIGDRFPAPRADVSELIALEIRRFVEREQLRPGDRIGTEQELALEFGVSRPTLREALRLLASSQLIRVGRGRLGGIFVARTPNQGMSRNLSESISTMLATKSVSMSELLEARIFLEVPLAGLAARHAGPPMVQQLEATITAQRGHQPGTPAFNAADARFHELLAEAAGNDLLVVFTGWILEVLQPSLVEVISESLRAEDIISQHADILRAVRRHQARAAERAMRAHLEHLLDVLRTVDNADSQLAGAAAAGQPAAARSKASAPAAARSRARARRPTAV